MGVEFGHRTFIGLNYKLTLIFFIISRKIMSDKSTNKIYCLVGDLQLKSMRLQLVEYSLEHSAPKVIKDYEGHAECYPSIREYITDLLSEFTMTDLWPSHALLAVSGAPYENKVVISGCHWPEISGDELGNEFNIGSFKLINTYVAVGKAITTLNDSQTVQIQDGEPSKQGTSIVIGLSDELGESTIRAIRGHDGCITHQIYESHGGLKQFSPTNELEWEYFQFMMQEDAENNEDNGYFPVEKAICDDGIEKIYRFLCHFEKATPRNLSSLEIMEEGLKEIDDLCVRSLNFMVRIFGNEVSNFAVDTIPTGGIFLVGRITNFLEDLLVKSVNNPFMAGYRSKGSEINETLSKFPIYIVDTDNLILSGSYILLASEVKFE